MAVSDTPIAVESFVRTLDLFAFMPEEFERLLGLVEAREIPFRNGPARPWEKASRRKLKKLGSFFRPQIAGRIFGSEGEEGALCEVRCLSSAPLSRFGTELSLSFRKVRFDVTIRAGELYMFRSGIGAACLEFACTKVWRDDAESPLDLNDLALLATALSVRSGPESARLTFNEERSGLRGDPVVEAMKDNGVSIDDLWDHLLGPDLKRVSADDGRRKVVSFAAVAEQEDMSVLLEPLFRMRRLLPAGPKPPRKELSPGSSPEVIQPFENMLVGCGLGGMAVLRAETGDVFDREVAERARRPYFAHYLLAVHQRAFLCDLERRLADSVEAGRETAPQAPGGPGSIARRLGEFSAAYEITELSSMAHYQDVYSALQRALGVEELLRALRARVTALEALVPRASAESKPSERASPVPPTGMHAVFVSYSKIDVNTALDVVARLEASDIPCWIAKRDCVPGRDYMEEVMEALLKAKVVLLVLSRASDASTHVRGELTAAKEKRIPIIPLRLQAFEVSNKVYYCLAGAHWLDASEQGLAEVLPGLMSAVSRHLAVAMPAEH